MTCDDVELIWIDGRNSFEKSEETARNAILKEYPTATFSTWTPCEEPEAEEGEQVMWAMVDKEPIAAIYWNPVEEVA